MSQKLLEDTVFFLDRSLGRQRLAAYLRQQGLRVEVHDDHFLPDARDEEWLRSVGSRGWVVISKDSRIRYRPLEIAMLIRHGVRAFVLTRGDWTADEMAEAILKALPRISTILRRHRKGFVATISRGGYVVLKRERQ